MGDSCVSRRREPFLILAAFLLIFAGPGATQGFIRNLVPETWSGVKVTSLLAALYFSFMVWRIGIVATQRAIGDKWSFVLALASYLAMPVALLFTPSYPVLFATSLVWGWGAAGLWQTGQVWLYDVTDDRRRGLWAGILYMLVFLGLIGGARYQGQAAESGDTRLLLLLSILPGLLGVGIAAFLPARPARAEALSAKTVFAMVFDRRVSLAGMLLFVSATAYGLLLGAFRDEVQEAFGPAEVGRALGAYFAVRLLVSVISGYSSDLFARRSVMSAAFAVGGVALFLSASGNARYSLTAGAACLGLVSAVVPVSTTALTADWFPAERRSLALGAAFVWRDAGMVVSLLAGQYLSEAFGGSEIAFIVFSAAFVLSAGLALLIPARQGRPSVSPGDEA